METASSAKACLCLSTEHGCSPQQRFWAYSTRLADLQLCKLVAKLHRADQLASSGILEAIRHHLKAGHRMPTPEGTSGCPRKCAGSRGMCRFAGTRMSPVRQQPIFVFGSRHISPPVVARPSILLLLLALDQLMGLKASPPHSGHEVVWTQRVLSLLQCGLCRRGRGNIHELIVNGLVDAVHDGLIKHAFRQRVL